MLMLLKYVAGPILGLCIGGLVDLFFPSAKQQVVQFAGGLTFANVLFWGAVGSFFAYVGIKDKAADAANPTILSRFLGLLRNAAVAILAGVMKLISEAKTKAGS